MIEITSEIEHEMGYLFSGKLVMVQRNILNATGISTLLFAFSLVCLGQEKSTLDPRDGSLKNLNGYFPFKSIRTLDEWENRKLEIRRRILVSQGLWPLPTRTELNAVIHGAIERDEYTVERVFFESAPGHFVTGSLYRPKGKLGPFPAILSPHGHWNQGRFYDAGEDLVQQQIQSGAENDEVGGRFPLQARAVQLARMGCVVFLYDMTGNADSNQIAHRPERWNHLDRATDWGFMSVQADLRLQNMMGLQTWNSIRALDFLFQLTDVDQSRIGVTGASGGGTQTMIIAAIDDRVTASMPCVMVSTAMQGGCTCENAPLLRIDQGNIDIAAAFAPKPLALTAADDWTIQLESKGFPDLLSLYETLGEPSNLKGVFRTEFKHNYNLVNRTEMYHFFNHHFKLGFEEPIVEGYYEPLTREEATVWTGSHAAPSGDQVGDSHEVRLLSMATQDSDRQMEKVVESISVSEENFRKIVGGAWETILGRSIDEVGDVSTEHVQDSNDAEFYGYLVREQNQERVRIKQWQTTDPQKGLVIMLTDQGLSDFESGGNKVATNLREDLADNGFGLIACDLYGQGETTADNQPMWYQPNGDQGWKRFSGYTYGYNHCLFVKRVHDVLTIASYVSQNTDGPIHLVGLGSVAGPVAVAARSQMGSLIQRTLVDTEDFQFRKLGAHNHPMFVPGAVKYLGLDGLFALCAPHHIGQMNSMDTVYSVAIRLYNKLEVTNHLEKINHPSHAIVYLSSN